jgi:16S rRNA (guanine(966)-N(2))-methyltransferase RsmD
MTENRNFTVAIHRRCQVLANEIRIIGGQWRGRRLRLPRVAGLRPTPDRVRETLFNWLGQDLAGRLTLDAFAGSGALSFEALSRGATRAVALESNRELFRALIDAARLLGTPGLEAHCADALDFLARETRLFDVVLLDPPFARPRWASLLPLAAARLAPEGFLYVEAPSPIAAPPGLEIWRQDKAGKVHYHLLRHAGRTE